VPNVATTISIEQEPLAKEVANMWFKWNNARNPWLLARKELREYLFATDTRHTANSKLPWKNSTVTPKLTQIRDNLHANYMAALFPSEDWFIWEGQDKDAVTATKRQVIEAYMKNKLKASSFELIVSQLVYDFIDYGNVIAAHEYVSQIKNDEDGNPIVKYIGPKAIRISPLDVCFDPTATTFDESPFIHRVVKSFGELEKDQLTKPNLGYDVSAIKKAKTYRTNMKDYTDFIKQAGWTVDGFNTLEDYFQSYNVELLHFWGDIYDWTTGAFLQDYIITVIDRCHILRMMPNPSWLGTRPYKHCGWRLRPDNLWAQGPLDQLVGMQYRLDHMENLKADIYDQMAHPIVIIKGDTIEDFKFGPGAELHLGDEGEAEISRPDSGAVNADNQIELYMQKMEELAGAPKQAMGIRTPGEKTKYEVQVLENGAGRIFQSKVNWFEKNIIEPLLNSMLEESRRNLVTSDQIKIVDPDTGVAEFSNITKEDITAKGKLYPIGARHFAEQAKFVQDMTTTLQLLDKMPTVAPHISGIGVAKALNHALGWEPFNIVQPNIAVIEQKQTQELINAASQRLDQNAQTPVEPQPGDFGGNTNQTQA
jgi:hypothetical protein